MSSEPHVSRIAASGVPSNRGHCNLTCRSLVPPLAFYCKIQAVACVYSRRRFPYRHVHLSTLSNIRVHVRRSSYLYNVYRGIGDEENCD